MLTFLGKQKSVLKLCGFSKTKNVKQWYAPGVTILLVEFCDKEFVKKCITRKIFPNVQKIYFMCECPKEIFENDLKNIDINLVWTSGIYKEWWAENNDNVKKISMMNYANLVIEYEKEFSF